MAAQLHAANTTAMVAGDRLWYVVDDRPAVRHLPWRQRVAGLHPSAREALRQARQLRARGNPAVVTDDPASEVR